MRRRAEIIRQRVRAFSRRARSDLQRAREAAARRLQEIDELMAIGLLRRGLQDGSKSVAGSSLHGKKRRQRSVLRQLPRAKGVVRRHVKSRWLLAS